MRMCYAVSVLMLVLASSTAPQTGLAQVAFTESQDPAVLPPTESPQEAERAKSGEEGANSFSGLPSEATLPLIIVLAGVAVSLFATLVLFMASNINLHRREQRVQSEIERRGSSVVNNPLFVSGEAQV
mmetsp:Transcript_6610/g.12205  ORF Transcript_6610/g.12205 Transcript_6610/m.12205 type:complete len:128 (-) Transcript_6610:25-408(-)